MYLGELVLRFSLVTASSQRFWSFLSAAGLVVLQVMRILKEESILCGYGAYAGRVRWRLLPGIW